MKSVSFEQMEAINGGGPASLGCGLLMTAWGGVLAAGLALGPVSAGVSVGVVLHGVQLAFSYVKL